MSSAGAGSPPPLGVMPRRSAEPVCLVGRSSRAPLQLGRREGLEDIRQVSY